MIIIKEHTRNLIGISAGKILQPTKDLHKVYFFKKLISFSSELAVIKVLNIVPECYHFQLISKTFTVNVFGKSVVHLPLLRPYYRKLKAC